MALALRSATPLRPEIRLAQALSEYEAVLMDDQKAKLRTYRGQQPPNVADVMRLTAEIDRDNSLRKSRRCVGPRLTSVLQAVQQFSTIIDIIVGGSQSLIASAIWGTVKMTLQITSSFTSYFDNLSTLFMNIGRSCPRYQEFGLTYPQSIRLQTALCEYFVLVVELCKGAVLFIRTPFMTQFSSSIVKPFQTEFGHFEIDLARLANIIREEASLASQQEQSIETKENSKFRTFAVKFSEKVSHELQEAKKLKSRKSKSQLLNACSTYNHLTAWKQARKVGTTSWIYRGETYKEWAKEPVSSVLWCTGILGSGKTVLSANLVENIIITAPEATVSYFFCKHDEAESLRPRTIIGSLARQLLTSAKPEIFDDVDLAHQVALDTDQILDHLRKLLPSERKEYFILIDGLDECNEKDLKLLLNHLKELITSRSIFRIYCSSRPDTYRSISAILKPRYHTTMSDTNSEIARYIENSLEERLDSGNLCLGDPRTILAIRDALVKGSQGMFLWVVLQLDSICSEATDENIIKALQSLPKDLPETFDRILRKIEQKRTSDPNLCKTVFEVVASAQRPLTIEELREAISVIPGETVWNVKKLVNDMHRTLSGCGSLLVVDEEHSTVHFAHHSVKQHLLSASADPDLEWCHMDSLEAEVSLGEICVTYLNLDVFNTQLVKTKSGSQSQPVDVPLAILNSTVPPTVVGKLAVKLLKGKADPKYDMFSYLKTITSKAEDYPEQNQLQHPFLAYAREYWMFHSKRFKPNRSMTYLQWCRLMDGEVGTVRLPWAPALWYDLGLECLRWTVQHEHGPLLYRIFDRFEHGGAPQINTLWELLLEKGAELNVEGMFYGNAVRLAISSNNEAIVRLLLKKGANLEPQDSNGRTPLLWAARNGYEAVVRLLIEKGVNLESQDGNGRTPLLWAARNGHEAVVRLLIEKGANLESQDGNGQTPLSWAARNGREAVVRLLLEKGANLESPTSYSQTPLSWAAEKGREAVVRLLLEKGANLESPTSYSQTPLLWAAEKGHEAVVRLLIENGANLESQDGNGQTPLSWAARNGHEAVVRLLIEKGANPESQNN